jgi:hypothetical protein
MATLDSDSTGGLPTVDAARHELARTATFEVQVLAQTLRTFIEGHDPGAEIAVVARGILTRICDLSDIVFESVINNDVDRDNDVPSLARQLGTDMEWLLQGGEG